MRLLKIEDDGELSLVEHFGTAIPPYAILSHTWGVPTEEVTFKDVVKSRYENKKSYTKIQFCVSRAIMEGFQHIWVDTCCIDKSSSAELSEAINSMFRWYREAGKCYVYMSDVSDIPAAEIELDEALQSDLEWERTFKSSRWFKRGWTLQELIAPKSVDFYSREGQHLGDRRTLSRMIHEATAIPINILQGGSLDPYLAAERLSWAAR
jgi:ribosomal protein S26